MDADNGERERPWAAEPSHTHKLNFVIIQYVGVLYVISRLLLCVVRR
jgi:hypothetical protein